MAYTQRKQTFTSPLFIAEQPYYVCPFVKSIPVERDKRIALGSTVWTKDGDDYFVTCGSCYRVLNVTDNLDATGKSPANGGSCTYCGRCGAHIWYLLEDWEKHK